MNDAESRDFFVADGQVDAIRLSLQIALAEMNLFGWEKNTILLPSGRELSVTRATAEAVLNELDAAAKPVVDDFWGEVAKTQQVQ